MEFNFEKIVSEKGRKIKFNFKFPGKIIITAVVLLSGITEAIDFLPVLLNGGEYDSNYPFLGFLWK